MADYRAMLDKRDYALASTEQAHYLKPRSLPL